MAFKKKVKKVPETFQLEEREEPMGEGEEMRNLCQEIAGSFDARMKRVADIKRETAELLKGFQRDLREKAADLKRFLSNTEASRMKDFRAMHQDIRNRQEERNREVANTLGGFRRAQKAMASHWHTMAGTMEKRRASFAR